MLALTSPRRTTLRHSMQSPSKVLPSSETVEGGVANTALATPHKPGHPAPPWPPHIALATPHCPGHPTLPWIVNRGLLGVEL